MMQSIERYMKQAIVDRNPAVSSAALVSSLVRLLFSFFGARVMCAEKMKVKRLS